MNRNNRTVIVLAIAVIMAGIASFGVRINRDLFRVNFITADLVRQRLRENRKRYGEE